MYFWLLILFLGLTLSSCDNGTKPTSHDNNAKLASKIDLIGDSLTEKVIVNGLNISSPGVTLGVINPEIGFTYLKSFGLSDISSGAKLFRADGIRIGAFTQSFIATLVLRLFDEGKFSLDDPISKYIQVPHSGSLIKIRHLLSMRSGIADFIDSVKYYQINEPMRKFTTSDLLNFAFNSRPRINPDIETEISSTNYLILGMLIESLTGENLELQLEKKVLSPLGLNDTYSNSEAKFNTSYYSKGYIRNLQGQLIDVTNVVDYSWSWSNANIISNPSNLIYMVEALGTNRLLNSNSYNYMINFNPIKNSINKQYGMGVMRFGGFLGFTSDFEGYHLSIYYLPSKDISLFAFANSSSIATDEIIVKLANLVTPGIRFE